MDAPEARFIERDGAQLAYQVVGERGADVLVVGEIAQHFDLAWTDPHIHDLYERGATFARTVYMQLRGFGLSEPINYAPTLEQHADDIVAVLDAAGVQSATLMGSLTTCAPVALVAARHPERVNGLVLFKAIACGPLAPSAVEFGWTPEDIEPYTSRWQAAFARWGSGATVDVFDPVLATSFNRRLMALLERCSAMPAAAHRYLDFALRVDAGDIYRAARTPAHVLYPPTGHEPEAVCRRVAELLPNATFYVMTPTPPGAAIGEAYGEVWDHIEQVATGGHHPVDADRFLGTVLFTDVVGSTELLARLGDGKYRELRAAHERQVRLAVEQDGGRFISASGDGTLSVFDGPTRAVRCAQEVCRRAETLGITIRAGVHTGEMERTGHDVTGLSVHIGARIGANAGAGEVLVSQTVRDLVTGSGLAFADRGAHELKGVPGRWQLYSLTDRAEQPAAMPDAAVDESIETPLDRAALRTARAAPWAMRTALRVGNAVQRRRARTEART